MAPLTRSLASVNPRQESFLLARQDSRESGWDFGGSEPRSREASEEPSDAASFHPGYEDGEGSQGPEEEDGLPEGLSDDILHPLRDAADRVGTQVEKFAETLDSFNPLRPLDDTERYNTNLELLDIYFSIAKETVEGLRTQISGADAKRQAARHWQDKVRHAFSSVQDMDDDMDIDDEASNQALVPHGTVTPDDLHRWEQEAQTWDLLRRLVRLHFKPPGADETARPDLSSIHRYSSEREIWQAFLLTDDIAKERHTVLKWLSQTADESGEDIAVMVQDLQQNADRGEIIAHGWLHTKAAIKNQKRINVWPHVLDPSSPEVREKHLNSAKTQPLVTQLDPDASTRQGRKLEAQDEYFERAIWLGCYELLRRGKSVEDIKRWCRERTEVWRAVSMSGFHDNELETQVMTKAGLSIEEPENPREVDDPKSAALWRRMCFALARNGGQDEFEKAVYGLLSGDISSVEPVCKAWDDFIFAHYNALLRTQYDIFVQTNFSDRAPPEIVQSFGTFDAIQFHGDSQNAAKSLVESLKQNAKTKAETKNPLKMLQGVLLSNYFADYVYHQGLALAKYANQESPSALIPKRMALPEREDINTYITMEDFDSLRVLVHMLLALKAFGLDLSQGSAAREFAIDNIIVAYCRLLQLSAKEEMIPLYAAQLSGDRVYACLGHSLMAITDHEQRLDLVENIKNLGLDVQKFVRFQTRPLLLEKDKAQGFPASEKFSILEDVDDCVSIGVRLKRGFMKEDTYDQEDYLLIRSFEWFLLVDGLWSETYRTGIMIYLRFFKNMHLGSARLLLNSVNSVDIAGTKLSSLLGEEMDLADLAADAMATGELEDEEELEMRMLKRHMYQETKLFRDLESLIETLDHLEVIDEALIHLTNPLIDKSFKKAFRKEMEQRLGAASRSVQQLLSKDWLQGVEDEVASQCKLIRETYLPQTIMAYLSVLNLAGCLATRTYLLEGINLSTIIADDDSDLSQLFIKTGYMPKLVEAFARLSKAVLMVNEKQKSGKTGETSKKMRELGWTRSIWNVSK